MEFQKSIYIVNIFEKNVYQTIIGYLNFGIIHIQISTMTLNQSFPTRSIMFCAAMPL